MHLLAGAIGAVEYESTDWIAHSGGACHGKEGTQQRDVVRALFMWTMTAWTKALFGTHHVDPALRPHHQRLCSYW